MREKAAVIFLAAASFFLGILCFFPKFNILSYQAQYSEGVKAKGNARLTMAERAVNLNPLYPRAHLLLASIYLENPEGLEKALRELDIAVKLGPYRKGISWNALKTYLSLWPFLSEEEREKALKAGKYAVRTASKRRIEEMVSLWRRFCRDFDFIYQVLGEKPGYMGILAREIYRHHLPLQWRWKALSLYEKWLFETSSRKPPEEMSISLLKKTLRILDSIKFYHRLAGLPFEEKVFQNYKERVLFQLATRTKQYDYIVKFLNFSSNRDRIKELRRALQEDGMLSLRDFRHFYIRELIRYKLREYQTLKDETEAFRESVKWVKKEELSDYININLLLADVYYEENLLLKASSLLEELLKLKATPEILLRVKRVSELTGENFSASIPGFYYSNPVTIEKANTEFLFSPPVGVKVLVLRIKSLPTCGGLLQIYLDGKIAHESYREKENKEITLQLPGERDNFAVEIRTLK